MDPSSLVSGRTRETRIRRDRFGRWFNGNDAIDHPNLVSAFNAWIDVAADGRFCLRNEINWAYVEVDGAPIFVHSAVRLGDTIELRLSDATTEELDPGTLRQDSNGVLFCSVRAGRLAARFDSLAAVQLVDHFDEDPQGPVLRLGNRVFRARTVDDPLALSPLPT